MTVNFLLFVLFGKLFIYAIPKFPPVGWLADKLHLNKLIECEFCLGTWVYFVFAFIIPVHIEGLPYIPIVSEFIVATATSFVVHLLSVGFRDLYFTVMIE